MKTRFDRSLHVTGLLSLALIGASCKGDMGPAGPAGPTGPSGVITTTVVLYLGTTVDGAPSTTFTSLRTLGTFSKGSATTKVQVVWNGHVTGNVAGPTDGYCTFQVRVDGNASTATSYPGATIGGAVGQTPYLIASTTDIFTGLAAGTHTLTLWDRGIRMTSCTDNPGDFDHWVIVTEY